MTNVIRVTHRQTDRQIPDTDIVTPSWAKLDMIKIFALILVYLAKVEVDSRLSFS